MQFQFVISQHFESFMTQQILFVVPSMGIFTEIRDILPGSVTQQPEHLHLVNIRSILDLPSGIKTQLATNHVETQCQAQQWWNGMSRRGRHPDISKKTPHRRSTVWFKDDCWCLKFVIIFSGFGTVQQGRRKHGGSCPSALPSSYGVSGGSTVP